MFLFVFLYRSDGTFSFFACCCFCLLQDIIKIQRKGKKLHYNRLFHVCWGVLNLLLECYGFCGWEFDMSDSKLSVFMITQVLFCFSCFSFKLLFYMYKLYLQKKKVAILGCVFVSYARHDVLTHLTLYQSATLWCAWSDKSNKNNWGVERDVCVS